MLGRHSAEMCTDNIALTQEATEAVSPTIIVLYSISHHGHLVYRYTVHS